MPLSLDPSTGCLPSPPALHEATADEVRATFVDGFPASQTRPAIWHAHEDHPTAWKPLLGARAREQWLNGSFVTGKTDPGDLDFATFVPLDEVNALASEQRNALDRLFSGAIRKWGGWLHAFMIPVAREGTPEATMATAQRVVLLQLFSRARPTEGGCEKGSCAYGCDRWYACRHWRDP